MSQMLTTEQIRQHFLTISYKPGWTFTLSTGIEGPQLRIRADLEDSYTPGQLAELGIDTYVPPCPDTSYLERWLLYRLSRIEIHEVMEWLKRDGVILFDPHAGEQAA